MTQTTEQLPLRGENETFFNLAMYLDDFLCCGNLKT